MTSMLIADESNFSQLQKMVKHFSDLGKIQLLLLKKEKPEHDQQTDAILVFSLKDLNIFGGVKNEELKKELNLRRDIVLVFGDVPKNFSKAIVQIPTNMRIGINSDSNLNFDVKLRTNQKEVQQLTNFANEILEKIK